jgi:serine/threonine-protein kinase
MAQADQAVAKDHFIVRTTKHAYSLTLGTGLILNQSPSPRFHGKPVTAKQGSTIDVTVSAGPPPVSIPSMVSVPSCAQAVAKLKTVNLVGVCPASAAQYSSTVVAGAIIGTSPPETARYGSTVTVIVSKGHAPVAVPVVTGTASTYATASAALAAAGFVPSENQSYDASVPNGQVIGTSPPASAGPQPYGSPVVVDVSLGPQPVTIPDVVGHSVASATHALEALGLHVAGPYGPPKSKKVQSTLPDVGTSVLPGTTVDLYTRS